MTKINRLTQLTTLEDSDLSVVWQDSSERTRAITIENLRNFIQSTDPNADAFVKAELVGDELVLTSHDEVETRIDINLLPEHSVTELKDMPDNLLSGQYLKVSDDGTSFVLTPSSEMSADILIQRNDEPAIDVNVLKFTDDVEVAIENKIATISINNQISPWPIQDVGIGDSPKVIDKVEDLGIEYQFEASSTFTQSVHLYHVGLPEGAQIKVTVTNVEPNSKPIDVFQLSAGSDLRWPVITPTVFTLRSGLWRVEESSQLLHVADATTFDDDAARKKIVHGVAVEPNSSITMDVNDDGVLVVGGGGTGDTPTFKRVDIDTNGSGQPNFTASIHQDSELHTVIDATRELRVNYKDIGTGAITTVAGIDDTQAQFLVPIYQGNDAVALAKNMPNTDGFIQKYADAELNKLYVAYQGKYGDDRAFYPISLYQDVNGWSQLEFSGNMQFKPKDKDTGVVGDKIFDVRTNSVNAYKKLIAQDGLEVKGLSTADKVSIEGVRSGAAYNNFTIKGSAEGGDDGSGLILKTYIRQDGNPNKDYIQYFGGTGGGNQLANTESVQGAIAADKAKGEWVGGVLKDTINDDGNPEDEFTCNDPKHWLEYRKTAFQGDYALTVKQGGALISSEIVIHLHPESGMGSAQFKVVTIGGEEATKTIRVGEKWRFFLRKGTGPYCERIDDGTASDGASSYRGEGEGIPYRISASTGGATQNTVIGHFSNSSSSSDDYLITLSEDLLGSVTYIDNNKPTSRSFTVKDAKTSRFLNRTIRPGERWACHAHLTGEFSTTNFEWHRMDLGTSAFDVVDVSSFDEGETQVKPLRKSFENKDLVSIPIELPEGFEALVSSVICKIDGRLKKQPFEYQYENGILRVHLNEVCSGIIIAELIK